MRTSLWTALAALVALTVRADTYELQLHAEDGVMFYDPWDGHEVHGPGWIWSPVNEGFPGITVHAVLYYPDGDIQKVAVSLLYGRSCPT
jgi:hypothetical protein